MKRIKQFLILTTLVVIAIAFMHCSSQDQTSNTKTAENMPDGNYNYFIVFLHHSTGGNVWNGNIAASGSPEEITTVPGWFTTYNKQNGTAYHIEERVFPKAKPYGWNNYPYDYYNIWVKNAGNEPFMDEPTLEILAKEYDMIIFKHCFPVSNISEDTGNPDINSPDKRMENYKLQYEALKNKMNEFPDKKFIVWTGAALTKKKTTKENAERAKAFFDWVRNEWDDQGDHIFLWDLYELETEGGLYLLDKYARNSDDPHLGTDFAGRAAKLFAQRIVDIIETNGENTTLTGEYK